jgi:hypothetical protein
MEEAQLEQSSKERLGRRVGDMPVADSQGYESDRQRLC